MLGQRDDGMTALAHGLELTGNPLGPHMKIFTRYGVVTAGAYLAAGLPQEAEAEAARGLALATVENARAYHVPLGRLRASRIPSITPMPTTPARTTIAIARLTPRKFQRRRNSPKSHKL